MQDLSKMRQEYDAESLNEADMASDPIKEFMEWMNAAIAAKLSEPNAMVIATSTSDGKPSARVVLLKEVNNCGFVFFTNYLSRKGMELLSNPFAAVVFDWHDMGRQVRIEGRVEKLSAEESDNYFNTRPENAKTGSWSSPQSKIIKSRDELDELQKETERMFAGNTIYRPSHWGGFLIRPEVIEFWKGRQSRMHDRIAYYKTEDGWSINRLAP